MEFFPFIKATPEARSEIVIDHAIPLDDALLQLKDFIAENAANGMDTVQVWGKGATFDNVLLGIHTPGQDSLPMELLEQP